MAALPIDQLFKPLTVAEARAAILSVMASLGLPVTSWQPGGVALALVTAFAYLFSGFTRVAVLPVRAGFLDSATGFWLTLLARQVYGVERIEASYARGTLKITNPGGGLFQLDPGDLLVRNPTTDVLYTNVAAFTLNPGAELDITIQAQEAGSAGTSSANTITSIVSPALIGGVTVTNEFALVGTNEERDDSLRERCRLKLGTLSVMGPVAAYEYWALSSRRDDGSAIPVNRVKVLDSSGYFTVTTIVATPSGAVTGTMLDPSTDLGKIHDNIIRRVVPLGFSNTTESALEVPVSVTCTVYVDARLNLPTSQVEQAIEVAVATYLSTVPIGGHVVSGSTGYVFKNALVGAIEKMAFDLLPEGSLQRERAAQIAKYVIKADATGGDVALLSNAVPTAGGITRTVVVVNL